MKLKKLDRRNRGYGWFAYCCEYSHNELRQFVDHRAWCWATFGPSCELKFWDRAGQLGGRWCWHTDEWGVRIYFAGDAELNWFKMAQGVGV